MAIELLHSGERDAAYKMFQKAVDITPALARTFITELRKLRGVECIVAPYEADAQLAYLSHKDLIHAVITEDSDLITFGAKRILYKMDGAGQGLEFRLRNLDANTDLRFSGWDHNMFQQMCIMAGCDYLNSIRQRLMHHVSHLRARETSRDRHTAIVDNTRVSDEHCKERSHTGPASLCCPSVACAVLVLCGWLSETQLLTTRVGAAMQPAATGSEADDSGRQQRTRVRDSANELEQLVGAATHCSLLCTPLRTLSGKRPRVPLCCHAPLCHSGRAALLTTRMRRPRRASLGSA